MAKSKPIDPKEELEAESGESVVLPEERHLERVPARPVARLDDLDAIADGSDGQTRTRAVERILSNHAAMRAELDRLTAQAGSQEETIARIDSQISSLLRKVASMKKIEAREQTPKSSEVLADYTKPENDRRVNDKLGFWERRSYSGPERRKKAPQRARKGFLVTRI